MSFVFYRTFTFWRFMIHIPLGESQMRVSYSVNNGIEMDFFVPGRMQNMRWAAYSVSLSPSCFCPSFMPPERLISPVFASLLSAMVLVRVLTLMTSVDRAFKAATTLYGWIYFKSTPRNLFMSW